jgi:hypothetical protein
VAHAYNPSYSGGRDQQDCGSKPVKVNSSWDPILKIPNTKKSWWSRALPSKCEALSSNPRTAKKCFSWSVSFTLTWMWTTRWSKWEKQQTFPKSLGKKSFLCYPKGSEWLNLPEQCSQDSCISSSEIKAVIPCRWFRNFFQRRNLAILPRLNLNSWAQEVLLPHPPEHGFLNSVTAESKPQQRGPGTVAHSCNPSYSGGKDQDDHCSRPVRAKS